MRHQIRGGFGSILGWDLTAGFAMAQAMGLSGLAVAELLPSIESVAIRKINEQLEASRND